MNEESLDTPAPRSPRGCMFGCITGVLLSGLLGAGLATWVIQQNAPGWVLALAVLGPPAAFVLVFGSVMLPRWIREAREAVRNVPSPESRAASASGLPVESGTQTGPETPIDSSFFPTVPSVSTEDGLVLPYRLSRAGIPAGCKFGCSLFVAIFWNGIVGVFLWQVIDKWNRGGPPWFEILFLTPFVVVGLVLIGAVFYSLYLWFVSALVGRVIVEVSMHPLYPGARCQVHVAQKGPVALGPVTLRLVCTESATYVAGTSKSTASQETADHLVWEPSEVPGDGQLPITVPTSIPSDAMHSFKSPNNEIQWTLRVSARVLGMPFSDDFSLCMYPRPTTEEISDAGTNP